VSRAHRFLNLTGRIAKSIVGDETGTAFDGQ